VCSHNIPNNYVASVTFRRTLFFFLRRYAGEPNDDKCEKTV